MHRCMEFHWLHNQLHLDIIWYRLDISIYRGTKRAAIPCFAISVAAIFGHQRDSIFIQITLINTHADYEFVVYCKKKILLLYLGIFSDHFLDNDIYEYIVQNCTKCNVLDVYYETLCLSKFGWIYLHSFGDCCAIFEDMFNKLQFECTSVVLSNCWKFIKIYLTFLIITWLYLFDNAQSNIFF